MGDTVPTPTPSWRTVPLPRLLLVWSILIGLLVVAFWLLSFETGPPLFYLVILWMSASKSAALLCMPPDDRRRLTWLRFIAFLVFGGIPQPRKFLPECVPTKDDIRPTLPGLLLNLIAGLFFLYAIPSVLPPNTPLLVRLWLGLIGMAFIGLFFRFDMLVLIFRWLGFGVEKCWYNPVVATTLSDFWGNRWNRVMSGLMRDTIFMPLARRAGATAAMVAVFVYSGVLHEFVSVAAKGGYGWPTLYFLIQGAGLWLEGRRGFRSMTKHRPWLGRVWTLLIVAAPLGLMFHWPCMERLMVPMLREMHMPGLPQP